MPEIRTASPETWALAADLLRGGHLVVFPTDTVYGIGCDPYNIAALDHIYEAKGRPAQKAIPLLLSGPGDLREVTAALDPCAQKLAAAFWPGALTLVVERNMSLPAQLGSGNTIAVRVPNHDGLRSLLAACGGALAVTSANRSGEPDALDAPKAADYLGDSVALYVGDGPSSGGQPSTIVSCVNGRPEILRQGSISAQSIFACLGG